MNQSSGQNRYRRVLLKLSGEALAGGGFGYDPDACRSIVASVSEIVRDGVEVGIVCGGGNIFRGARSTGLAIPRVTGDGMGMLATMMNGLALRELFRAEGLSADVMSSLPLSGYIPSFDVELARKMLHDGVVLIFAGGTGHPYFSTDTAAALRAFQIQADILIKATRVDGVFDRDPEKDTDAIFFPRLTYADVLRKDLKVMDAAAVAMCRDQSMPIRVMNLLKPGNLKAAVYRRDVGTLISEGENHD